MTRIDELVLFAKKHRMPAVALTDVNALYAAISFIQCCKAAGVKPIIGAEITFSLDEKSVHDSSHFAVTLLAQSVVGYGQLCRLVSAHHLREDGPLRLADVLEHARDLVCLVGPAIPLDHSTVDPLRDAFAERLYVELSLHHRDEIHTLRKRAAAADAISLPVVATCASRCVLRDDVATLKAYSSIGTLTMLDQPHPSKPRGTYHLRPPDEMLRLFARRPDAIRNTFEIADRCNLTIDTGRNRFPGFRSPDGRSAMQHLRELSVAGCRRRYIDEPPLRGIGGKRATFDEAIERLDRELAVIDQVHYAEYFLVFHEIVEYCRSRDIAFLARGSAADSLVCYALGVSHACPFRFDLPFDRFINPERAEFSKMADIDLDLPWDRRGEVIDWVYRRWGNDRVAMIGSANTFHARAAVAELGKVFGLPSHQVHRTTKLIPRTRAYNVHEAVARSPEACAITIGEEPYCTILKIACKLEGLPRHWSMHPCGMVVSPEPLSDIVPVQRSAKGPLVAQYEMDSIEDLGFVKIDLLGQAGLSVLRDSVAEIKRTEGIDLDLVKDIDYSDRTTWDMIAAGEARGVHHIESPAMTSLIKQCNVRDIDCLTVIVAIVRPGAANQGKKDLFARRYQGFESPRYAHSSLKSVLEKTYGIMVFEEHILQVATEFAGMNLGRADVLRRALNKEKLSLMCEMKSEFRACAKGKGRSDSEIGAVWPLLESFVGFMFNKAHSAEYAVEAFQGAYLKRRWPAHYIAAILSNYRGFYVHSPTMPQILYVMEALRHGVRFLPPCINRSRERFAVESDDDVRIRIPLSHINGLSQSLIDRHLIERAKAPFRDAEDFVRRCHPREADTNLLLDTGAFDVFGCSRPELFWQLRRLVRSMSAACDTLFDDVQETEAIEKNVPPVTLTKPTPLHIARREMELLGFPVTFDPLTFLGTNGDGRRIDWSRYVPVDQLSRCANTRVWICGLMVADRVNQTTAGDLMKFVTLADRTGFVETLLFPDTYQRFGHLTVANPILAVRGVVEPFENGNGYTFRVDQVAKPIYVNSNAALTHSLASKARAHDSSVPI